MSLSFFLVYFLGPRPESSPRSGRHLDEPVGGTAYTLTRVADIDTEQIEEELELLREQIINTTSVHQAADINTPYTEQQFLALCTLYEHICRRTRRQGVFDRSERYIYQGLAIALIREIDTNLNVGKTLEGTFSQLMIYQHPEHGRGSAGHTTVRINTQKIPTLREYREVLTHEFGHTVDLALLVGTRRNKHPKFTEFGKVIWPEDDPSIAFYEISRLGESTRRAEASFKDFVSGYAMKNVYEDFAESKNLWFNHNHLFQEIARTNPILAKKYAYFQGIYENNRFDSNQKTVGVATSDRRPWDTTRIQ